LHSSSSITQISFQTEEEEGEQKEKRIGEGEKIGAIKNKNKTFTNFFLW
jgi:hypothetical protein